MPHIRLRSLNDEIVKKLSLEIPPELSPILQTPVDNFTVEKVATQYYRDGAPVEGDPMIEFFWFDRGQEVKSNCAKKITELVRKHSKAEYIAVVFTAIPKESYFENGEHF